MTEQRDPAASGEPVDSDPRVETTPGDVASPNDQGAAMTPPPGVPGDLGADVGGSDPLKTEPKPPTPFDPSPFDDVPAGTSPSRDAGVGEATLPPGTPAAAEPTFAERSAADNSTASTGSSAPADGAAVGAVPPGTPAAADPAPVAASPATAQPATPTDPPVAATAPMDPAEMPAQDPADEVTAPGTAVSDDDLDQEAERLAARAAERAERNRSLGKVDRPAPEPPPVVLTTQVRTTDRWHGALGLFVLRIVLGAIMFIHGIQHLTSIGDTQQFVAQSTVLPYPEILGWVLGIGELLVALALIFGFLVRVAGVGAMAISIMALAFVLWGSVNPFEPNVPGFLGELELLIVAVGFLFLLVGGGRWGVDGAMRARRRLKKEAAASNN